MSRGAEKPARVVYVSALMGRQTCRALFENAPFPPSQAAQKYHGLLARGLLAAGAEVRCVTPPPVSRTTSCKRFLRLPGEKEDGIRFSYLPVVDLPVVRHGIFFLGSFFVTLFQLHRNAYVLCDGLCIAASGGARAAARLMGRPCTAIVTDVPEVLGGSESRTARLNTRELAKYDGYLLLTKAMSDRVNPRGKPVLVAEGLVDETLMLPPNARENKYPEKVCLYAGMLHEKYGILRLTEAFSQVEDPDARLEICGTGDGVEKIRMAAARDARILYEGVRDNAWVVQEEIRATLLINPRPSDEEFTKFSFPSKNLEYMVSGTPMLTTRLPGMPAEYNDYVYLFDEETPEAMADQLRKILALPSETLAEKGRSARGFVLANKNNRAQAERLLTFMEGL